MLYVLLIITGLALGSFVNALVWRVYEQAKITDQIEHGKKLTKADKVALEKLSIAQGRSMCLHCKHELAPKDLIPVLSWLSLRGKCRYCGQRIPDTPVAELLVPALFVASYVWWPYALNTDLAWFVFAAWLGIIIGFVALTLYDFRWFLLPDRIVFPLTGIGVVYVALRALEASSPLQVVGGSIWAVVILAGLFYALFTVSNGRWIGGGDVKLAILLGLVVGGPIEALLVIFISSLTGLGFMLPNLLKGEATGKSIVPFGPFLIAGTILVVLFGQQLIDWYLGALI
ncbi:prepilin peptidase [Candidatus Saccharibacteria bacterium]|nr:prepilin peptidase [Candidatus Saccharibacteria bacterium]